MLALLSVLLATITNGELVGPVTITENGQKVTRYVVSTYSPLASTNGSAIMLQHNSNVQIANTSTATYSPNIFQQYMLKGKTVTFTVDLSQVDCSCNAAAYFVTMPGYGGNYYCDANDVNGEWCWELDVMEANKYVTAATPHECYQEPGGYISSCDRGGCGTNSHNVDGNGMGPGSQYKINTNMPFKQAMQLTGSSITVTMTQGSNTFSYQVCSNNGGYVSKMNDALDYGMVFVFSYWGSTYSTMQWLDGMTGCSPFSVCSNGGYVSNMNQALDYGMVLVFSYWGSTYSTMQWLDGMTGCSGDCAGTGLATFSNIIIG
eukprot:CAMPEP_0201591470 /NCGR_PEP_ID=MMETSP0190_2-20130828/189644_1 /ASSEMBLY_ACC=CAM_ASM_000263 /TAXON_ID=37353 /ORGANISM="Rosalina sp." /LENGTH=317 /DNA_ID=CAMNT_0048049827 /DNA_START=49 /DNA_END=1002 /DNA_ORIENTATION=-